MSFIKDKKWLEAKKIAKINGMADNWIEIIDYYNSIGGCHALIYTVIDEVRYRILSVLDTEEILLIDRDNKLAVKEYEEVLSSRKQFFYSEEALKLCEITLPTGYSIQNKNTLKINM